MAEEELLYRAQSFADLLSSSQGVDLLSHIANEEGFLLARPLAQFE